METTLTAPNDPGVTLMTDDDAAIFKALMSTKEAANVIIPDDISTDDLLRYLSVTAKAINKAQDAMTRLKPFLGRILLVAKERKLWKDLGYSSYDDWMTRGVRDLYGVNRTDGFACVKIAETLGFLPTEKVEELGFSKLSVLATAIRRSTDEGMPVEMREARTSEWVKAAEEHTVREFKDLIVTKGYADKGELDAKVPLMLMVNPEQKKFLDEFVGCPEVQSYCGSSDAGTILVRSAEEARGEWTAQVADSLRG